MKHTNEMDLVDALKAKLDQEDVLAYRYARPDSFKLDDDGIPSPFVVVRAGISATVNTDMTMGCNEDNDRTTNVILEFYGPLSDIDATTSFMKNVDEMLAYKWSAEFSSTLIPQYVTGNLTVASANIKPAMMLVRRYYRCKVNRPY